MAGCALIGSRLNYANCALYVHSEKPTESIWQRSFVSKLPLKEVCAKYEMLNKSTKLQIHSMPQDLEK